MLKTIKLAVTLFILFTVSSVFAEQENNQRYLEESRKTAQEFVQKLGGILKSQLETAGTEQAILVCKEVAPALANEYSNQSKSVKRVSLKNRNPNMGIPDNWETHVLNEFDAKNKLDSSLTLEKYETVKDADGQWFRYMRAIPTQPMCLQCHGKPDDIKPNIQTRLSKEYPLDKAIGYSAGEIRGAVTIRYKLN